MNGRSSDSFMIYPKLLIGFGMLVFFRNLSCLEFWVTYFALICLLSVIDSLEWFWMGSLHKNIQLILEFLKTPFLVQHLFYYTLMIQMLLSVIWLSMLIMLLSTLSVVTHLICGNNYNWLLNSNLINKTL